MKYVNQKGFSAVEFLLIAVILGIVGFAGYMVYDRQQDDKAATTESSQADDVSTAPDIKDTGDLDAAAATLNQTDTSSDADSTKLDENLNSF